MGKRIMLVDPQIKNEPLYVDFYDKHYAPVINDQYVCDLTPKQVLQIMNSESYQRSIEVETEVIDELRIEYKENKYFLESWKGRINNENNGF